MATIHGTNGSESRFAPLNEQNTLYAYGGNDYFVGGDLQDFIDGGDGNDWLFGRQGPDYIYGGNGNDFIVGDQGDDHLYGDQGDDSLYGEEDNDYLNGGYGNDILNGGSENDVLLGGSGNDTLTGGSGIDYVEGGLGQDTFVLTSGGVSPLVSYIDSSFDVIQDYTDNYDVFKLDNSKISFSHLTIVQGSSRNYVFNYGYTSGDALIYHGNDLLAVVQDTTASSITAADFVA
jgi:Ca2+-binding RTX toxin-like protein